MSGLCVKVQTSMLLWKKWLLILLSEKSFLFAISCTQKKQTGQKGGASDTETQIVSLELYNELNPVDQRRKFVAVVTENDHNRKPCLPTFLEGRIDALSSRKVI